VEPARDVLRRTEMPARARNDLTLYDRHAEGWWDAGDRAFASLRSVNEFRLAWLRRNLPGGFAGMRVADLGCGGGLLAVPLAAEGAAVAGVDLSQGSLLAARAQARGQAWFARADMGRCPLAGDGFDLVLLADVLEHVPDWRAPLAEAARLLRAGGVIYVNTINRTRRARWLAVALAEGLGFLPRGTHDPDLFVPPAELRAAADALGLRSVALAGEAPALVATLRARAIRLRPSRSLAVAYAALFAKERRGAPRG
jgi:2-polyprenyl-6-hydroxyphenyl methylase/3-demethylubiquinone-9 3-methyltransferase